MPKDRQSLKVLMVEDDLNNHQLFHDAFEASGFEVTIRETADGDFLPEAIFFKPDIISMDLLIGKEGTNIQNDGFDAIQLLKGENRTKEIPIIVLTNFFGDEKVQRAKDLGAVDFLSLQGQDIKSVPDIFKRYLEDPGKYIPTHPTFRA